MSALSYTDFPCESKNNLLCLCLFLMISESVPTVLMHMSLFGVQVVVPGTTAVLQNLLPDTDYNVGVVALYSDGEGPAINDAGKTCENPKRHIMFPVGPVFVVHL